MLDKNDRIPPSALWLGLSGALPFWAAGAVLWAGIALPWGLNAVEIAIGYGAVILSFLGGIRWGMVLGPADKGVQARSFGLSVVPSLVGFTAILLPNIIALCLLITGFLSQALWDVMSAQSGRMPHWFVMLRLLLTALVVTALLLVLAFVLFG